MDQHPSQNSDAIAAGTAMNASQTHASVAETSVNREANNANIVCPSVSVNNEHLGV